MTSMKRAVKMWRSIGQLGVWRKIARKEILIAGLRSQLVCVTNRFSGKLNQLRYIISQMTKPASNGANLPFIRQIRGVLKRACFQLPPNLVGHFLLNRRADEKRVW